ncbi:MAG: hypothetical protein CO108_20740 [Deltaproteobacteria bacterium CG_4_9_14_3_um_filter_63_12]|nr:MAG: hypothetical protein COW42_05350 [Deltaproteobacteria bacterium CG17_big_fil_post_rev_8_21_14_2_50_63_7]PJB37628.1 MAG: hypothetical protein CO108_20740 [Deltaproteobacteria bacterium CG_4_9_14_3_um_filter_63_12]
MFRLSIFMNPFLQAQFFGFDTLMLTVSITKSIPNFAHRRTIVERKRGHRQVGPLRRCASQEAALCSETGSSRQLGAA